MSSTLRQPTGPRVILLHGFMGWPSDLEPFARSLGVAGSFAFPEGPIDLTPRGLRGRAWWPIDVDARADALARGPRDLSNFVPEGLDDARAYVEAKLDALSADGERCPLVLGGFSQGAMLACELAFRTSRRLDGLVLFSGAPIGAGAWLSRYSSREGLPTFMSHGRSDDDLSFAVAESFQAELARAGLDVTWCPFAGGHEIPLVAWRAFRRWLTALSPSALKT